MAEFTANQDISMTHAIPENAYISLYTTMHSSWDMFRGTACYSVLLLITLRMSRHRTRICMGIFVHHILALLSPDSARGHSVWAERYV